MLAPTIVLAVAAVALLMFIKDMFEWKGFTMVHQIILPVERSEIVNKHWAEFISSSNPVERSILWKKVIHDFRTCTFTQTRDEGIVGGRIYWLTPIETNRLAWYEIAQGTVIGLGRNKYVVRCTSRTIVLNPNQVVAIERKRSYEDDSRTRVTRRKRFFRPNYFGQDWRGKS